jgi:hypothetical protein
VSLQSFHRKTIAYCKVLLSLPNTVFRDTGGGFRFCDPGGIISVRGAQGAQLQDEPVFPEVVSGADTNSSS